MVKQPTELLSPEQLVDLVAEFIKDCREQRVKAAASEERPHLAVAQTDAERPTLSH